MSARAIADLDRGIILASIDIKAPCERVFSALTRSADIVQWWGAPDAYQTTEWSADLRVGGAWLAKGRGKDGELFSVEGNYLEISPPSRLVYSWRAAWDGGHETVVAFRLTPIEIDGQSATRLTLSHDGFADRSDACQGHGLGWQRVLGWLGNFLAPKAPPQIFVARLLAPRPDFPFTMSAEERAMMEAHALYWRGLAAQGKVIAVGPVADPAGVYGLGLIRAADADDLGRLLEVDPAITAGRGMRYETAPMLSAILPDEAIRAG